MKKTKISAGLASLILLCSSAAHAVCHVDANASGSNLGTSWINAYPSLQTALGNAACGEIWVAQGTYRPGSSRSSSFSIRAGSTVLGGFAGGETSPSQADPKAHPTILSGNIGDPNVAADNSYHVVLLDGTVPGFPINTTTVLDGFNVRDGNADGGFPDNSGGGLYCRGDGAAASSCSPTLSRLRFTANAARNGGAMFLRADFAGKASPTLSDVEFSNNLAIANGGAIYVWATLNGRSNPAISRATFFANSADRGGAIFTEPGNQGGNADVVIDNATFTANDASLGPSVGGKGGAIYNKGAGGSAVLTLAHVTFSGNLANGSNHFGGALVNTGSGANARIANTVFWANQAASIPEILNSSGALLTIATSIVAGGCPTGATCSGLIDADPELTALSANGGFTSTMPISATGAAFDAADDAQCTVTDQRGITRPQGAHCDIGAFERVAPHLCHVDQAATGANDGLAWSTAYVDLQSALNDANCNEVWVATGLYKPTPGTDVAASFNIRPGLPVYGGFIGGETSRDQAAPGTNRTVLSGDVDGNDITDAAGAVLDADPAAGNIVGNNSRIVVRMNGTTAAGSIGPETVLDGFTVTAGVGSTFENINTAIAGGLYCNGKGSGRTCSPTLSRLTFSGNKAADGGALLLRGEAGGTSSPTISASTFTGNYAGLGAAIYSYGFGGTASPRITNSTFSNNTASRGAAIVSDGRDAGGVSMPVISNSTFVDNKSGSGVIYKLASSGGMVEARFENVILWNPGAPESGTFNTQGSNIIDHSVIEGGCPAAQTTCQDISVDDPLLGSLQNNGGETLTHLPGPNGSAIDAADPASCGNAPLDVDQRGIARPQGPDCDIGAIELRQAQFAVSVSGPGSISANASSPSASGGIINCEEDDGNCVAGYAIEPTAATIVLDITPANNANLDSIIDTCGANGDAIGVLAGTQYTVTPVTLDCLVIATFALDSYSVGGSVSGLIGSGLALQLNADEILPIASDGSFQFDTVVESGSPYAVTIATQPGQLTQTCIVANGEGVIDATDITNVEVTCTTDTFTVGGQVTGLLGSGLNVQLGSENLPISSNGSFTFPTPIASGSAYAVVVATSPTQPTQLCTVSDGSGTVGASDITNVAVTCDPPTPSLVLSVENRRDYLRIGRVVDYIVTLQNEGEGAASNIAVSSVLSSAFDGAFAQWQCFGAGAGAQCTAAGNGPLLDTATLPAGRTLTWRISVPVRADAAEDDATFTVSIDGAMPPSASDTDLLVLLRDGFDEAYGSGSHVSEPESQAIIDGVAVREIDMQQPGVDLVDTVMTLRANGVEIFVQRTGEDAQHSWMRLMQRNREGIEKITRWAPVSNGAHVVIGSMADAQGARWILLEGTENPVLMQIQLP